ncbi:MAG: ATP-dependent Clp protease ATP-binding subunit [Myxococcales bacterium]|nr:ATP-dependent Clp protease ATP-binding subunit [Myxococcales bacterium]MCB9670579.1 ATP-dependent Clp protease ATP-binding subunit [Alphaproteobacteria bacterium]MCB9691928.1 ATP-dependent Clp protease ATP-binding subunit [Alphaproteobacteria bacterium]
MADAFAITVAALVALDKRDTFEVRLPGLTQAVFRGPSLAELLDDAAIHLMEHVPKSPPDELHRLLLSPEVTLRKTEVDTAIAFGDDRKLTSVKVRLTAFCTRWSAEGFWRVQIPRLGPETFAVDSLSALPARLGVYLAEWAKKGRRTALMAAEALQDEHLELLDVEVDLPSVLPSRKPRRAKATTSNREEKDPAERVWRPAWELRSVGVNLVQRARDGRLQPALGRDAIVDLLVEQLDQDGSTVLLVGEPGVGKTAIIEAVAQRFADRGGTLQERTDLWRVDAARLIAGMSMVGQWEARLAAMVDELFHRRDILVVDDLPGLAWVGRSAQSEVTMADFLVPHLQRGEIKVLAECTPERLEAARLKNPGFFAGFRVLHIEPLDARATYRVLLQHTRAVEEVRNLAAEPALLETAMRLAERFGPRMEEPGRSVRVLHGFLGDVEAEREDRFGRGLVGPGELFAYFSRATGLPRYVLEPETARSDGEIRAWFERHIIGQPHAVRAATDAVLCLQQGLDDPEIPVATLLFVGPTGVGKTETAKALAAWLFGDAKRLLRFDMSEVSGPSALRRLVGGAGRPDGDLTRAVANQPFSVVLLDEIEKAGPEVFDLLLQVLGEGRLTNAAGHTTDFRNTVVVMTSNLGVASARRRTGFERGSDSDDEAHYRAAARDFFRPELYNRIGQVVPFRALGPDDVEPLVQRIVGRVLSRRGLRRSGVVVSLDDSLRDWIGTVGFDATYGARSLQRVVEREVTVPLARLLVGRPVSEGGAYIAMWRTPDGLGLHLDPLDDLPRSPVPLGLPGDWDAMEGVWQRLVELHTAVAGEGTWEAIGHTRSELLAALSEGGTLEEDGWDRLQTTTAVVEEHAALAGELEDFQADWLARYRFEDGYAKIGELARRPWGHGVRDRLVTQHVPVPVDRGRNLERAARQLATLEERVGALVFRVRSWGPPQPVVVRVDPLHREAHDLAKAVLEGFLGAWGEWGRLESWVRRDGTWKAGQPAVGACALSARVPGLAALLTDEAGLWLDAEDFGADRLLRLVRVSVLHGEAAEVLEASDADAEAARAARVAGSSGTTGFPGVRRRFGVLASGSDSLALDGLVEGLRSHALRRVVREP